PDAIVLTLARRGAAAGNAGTLTSGGGAAADRELAMYAARCAALNLPATPETAVKIRGLLTQNPDLTLDEAVFLAANDIPASAETVPAARGLLSGAKTGELLDLLRDLIQTMGDGADAPREASDSAVPAAAERMQADGETVSRAGEMPRETAVPRDMPRGDTAGRAELSAWLETFLPAAEPSARDEVPVRADVASGEEIPAREDNAAQAEALPRAQNPARAQNPETARADDMVRGAVASGAADIPGADEAARGIGTPPRDADVLVSEKIVPEETARQEQPQREPVREQVRGEIRRALTELFAERPEFKGVPAKRVSELAGVLADVVEDARELLRDTAPPRAETAPNVPRALAPAEKSAETLTAEKLAAFVDKLFTRTEGNGGDGAALRKARAELLTRLTLVEETAARSELPGRAAVTEQTRRLTNHVSVLSDIEQYAYVQLPVTLAQERKTAELYVYKRNRNGRRIDPNDANLLLALELTNMGHWEAFVNVRGKEVSVKMTTESEGARSVLEAAGAKLHGLLSEAGYKLSGMKVTCSGAETTPLTAMQILRANEVERVRGIDLAV
ncbi:MAG: flagellar hook-length control protein FliK, partial [Oscillospiraceae bacterium]|nr:flagellar hook-length control protein FliK [Oscillospiraceae bacterium]